jgi:osmotically-inducible protein OsmY
LYKSAHDLHPAETPLIPRWASFVSASAQNTTIVTIAKSVTLKGEVRDQKERDRVIEHARQMTGPRSINNQLLYTE